jgi:polyisoprenoid-binding protein YceI
VKLALLVVVLLAVAGPVGAWVYFNVIQDDPPERLSLERDTSDTTAGSDGAASGDISGTWKPTSASQVGYRVNEVAFGQKQAAVGRTNKVIGELTIDGTTVSSANLTVDMTSVASDEDRRDNQFRGRIMNVSSFPAATFVLTEPITLSSTTGTVSAKATGKLTLRGTTKTVTFDVNAERGGANIRVNGTIPIVFDEWSIPNPSFGPVSTEDHGELELLVVFAKSP